MKKFLTFLKGVCMGSADIIPGVSGGTMALILGIYKELVDSIKGLNLRWVPALWRWLTGGRKEADWEEVRRTFGAMNLPFLIALGLGIVTAIGVGSVIIPELMDKYPTAMRAFFFGLILASTWVPFRMMRGSDQRVWGGAMVIGVLALVAGWILTNPGRSLKATQQMKSVVSSGESLKELTRQAPSAAPAVSVYWDEANSELREAIRRESPETARKLKKLHEEASGEAGGAPNKEELKKRSEPYQKLKVPEGVAVSVPRPAGWFVFLAGAVAICAMILPGISGSFILLILGAYFFVLNALKGTIEAVLRGEIPMEQASFVALFMAGAAIGILSFARLLSYLLARFPALTLAGLVGLMVGCLRGIWPFRGEVDGVMVNVMPEAMNATVMSAIGACIVGAIVVAVLTVVGQKLEESDESGEAAL